MVDRLVGIVGDQILLADIGDVARFHILGEQMVERLVLARPDILRDRLIPFRAVGEDRIDIEDHAAKIEYAVAHDIADREARMGNRGQWDFCIKGVSRDMGRDVGAGHVINLVVLLPRTSG